MRNFRSLLALICTSALLLPPVSAQQSVSTSQGGTGITSFLSRYPDRFKAPDIAPINLSNSTRLEALIRSGRLYLSLQDAIALAIENNLDVESARYGPEIAKAQILRAEAGGLLRGVNTSVTGGPTSAVSQLSGGNQGNFQAGSSGGAVSQNTGGTIITSTGVAIPNFDDVFVASFGIQHNSTPQSNPVATGVSVLVNQNSIYNAFYQKAFATGTTVQASYNDLGISANSPYLSINPYSSTQASIQIQQRLLQGWGSGLNNRNIIIAKKNVQLSDLTFKNQVIATVQSTVNLYYDLVSYSEDVKVKHEALSYAEKLYSDNKKQVEIGTLAPIEIVKAEAEVATRQQDLTVSETQLFQQETIIKNYLSRTGVSSPTLADARVVPVDKLTIPESEQIRPIQDLVTLALAKRPEIAQTDLNLETTRLNLLGSKNQLKPSLDLTANLQNNGLAGTQKNAGANTALIGGFGTSLSQIFKRDFPNYYVAIQLTVPLRNRSAMADVINDTLSMRQAEIAKQKQLNQVRVDVQNAVIGIEQARARYAAAVKSRVLQEQSLDAEQKKYALGASTIFFVIQAQRDLATSQGNEVSAIANYAHAKTTLQVATGQILDDFAVVMDEASKGKVSRAPQAINDTEK